MFETDGNNWNRFIIPDTYGNKSNNIKADDVLTPEEYKTMLAVVQQIIPAGETQIETAPIPYAKGDTVYLENGTPFLIEKDVYKRQMIKGADTLFLSDRESVGKCPRCGGAVSENKKGFCCSDKACGFAIWKENRFFTAKKKTVTKAIVTELLKNGKVPLKGCYSRCV